MMAQLSISYEARFLMNFSYVKSCNVDSSLLQDLSPPPASTSSSDVPVTPATVQYPFQSLGEGQITVQPGYFVEVDRV
jgi:hypothetical protein